MIKYYELGFECNILIYNSINEDDILNLESFFLKNYKKYNLEFHNIYNIPNSLVNLLYNEIDILKKDISLKVYKDRLSSYLYNLGFKTLFTSELSKHKIKNPNIDIIAIENSAKNSENIINILSSIDIKKFSIFIIQSTNNNNTKYIHDKLTNCTKSKIINAKHLNNIKKGHIYIIENNKHLRIENSKISLQDASLHSHIASASVSFNALSSAYKETLLAVMECRYTSGSFDLFKQNNSTLMMQEHNKRETDNAQKYKNNKNIFEFVFSTPHIISYINTINLNFNNREWIKYLFDEIYKIYEYDFRLYSIESVSRRIESFMIKYSVKDIKIFVMLILYDKNAFRSLFLELSVNVTEFFRKVESSKKLIESLNQHKNNYKIKIWSAGCSTGEEVYSTAIILNELGLLDKSLLYATDFNPVVIAEAKSGIYSIDKFEKAKEKYKSLPFKTPLDDYFKIKKNYVEIQEHIKQKVMFFIHNLEKDSVFNEFDIIECKNVLIYFTKELQERVFTLFYDSLKFGGHLFLGPSELLPHSFEEKFERPDNGCKIYKKVA